MYTNILFPPPPVYEAPACEADSNVIIDSISSPILWHVSRWFPQKPGKKTQSTKESDKMVTPPQKETSLPTGAKMVVSGRVPHKDQFYMNFTWNIPLLEIWLWFFHVFPPFSKQHVLVITYYTYWKFTLKGGFLKPSTTCPGLCHISIARPSKAWKGTREKNVSQS